MVLTKRAFSPDWHIGVSASTARILLRSHPGHSQYTSAEIAYDRMSASKTHILLLGATGETQNPLWHIPTESTRKQGYIGGTLLQRLIAHPSASTFDITILIRNPDKAKIIESAFGNRVKPVVGHHGELDKIESLAESAHIVINVVSAFMHDLVGYLTKYQADSDDVALTKAILSGLRKSHTTALGDPPILIHTVRVHLKLHLYFAVLTMPVCSREQVFLWTTPRVSSRAKSFTTTRTRSRSSPSRPPRSIETSISSSSRRISKVRLVQAVWLLEILTRTLEGYARTYIVLPCTVYGIATGPLFDSGFANRYSIQIPALIKAALTRKRAGVLGQGKPVWTSVHIDDSPFSPYLVDRCR